MKNASNRITASQARRNFNEMYNEFFEGCEPDGIRKYVGWTEYKESLIEEGLTSEAIAERWSDPKGCS